MTHREAVEEMKKLAGDKAWMLAYQVGSYINGTEIHGYIADMPTGHARPHHTYSGAIENVRLMLGLAGCDPAPEEAA